MPANIGPHVLSCTACTACTDIGADYHLLVQLASSNPLAYMSLVEIPCRAKLFTDKTIWCTLGMLLLPDLLVGEGHPTLLCDWQHQKAFISALASWTKGYISKLKFPECGGTSVGAPGPEKNKQRWLGQLQLWLRQELEQQKGKPESSRGPRMGPWYLWHLAETVEAAPAVTNVHLVVVLWLARAVASVIELHLAGRLRVSRGRGGRSSIGGVNGSSSNHSYMQAMEAMEILGQGGAYRAVMLSDLEEVPVVLALLQLNLIVRWQQKVAGAEGLVTEDGRVLEFPDPFSGDPAAQKMIIMQKIAEVAGAAVNGGDGAGEGEDGVKGASAATAAATTASTGAGGGLAAADAERTKGFNAVADARATSSSASSVGGGGKGPPAAPSVPKRLSKLPQCGLPPAVVHQLDHISSSWSEELLGKVSAPSGREQQQQVLRDVLGLCRVLLAEVPSPVGCNNPECLDRSGVSEAELSSRGCSGCRVARYQLPITKWPHQSGAPVGAAPPTKSQLRLQRRTQTPVQNSHNGCHQPTLDPLLANVCQASPFRLAMC